MFTTRLYMACTRGNGRGFWGCGESGGLPNSRTAGRFGLGWFLGWWMLVDVDGWICAGFVIDLESWTLNMAQWRRGQLDVECGLWACFRQSSKSREVTRSHTLGESNVAIGNPLGLVVSIGESPSYIVVFQQAMFDYGRASQIIKTHQKKHIIVNHEKTYNT